MENSLKGFFGTSMARKIFLMKKKMNCRSFLFLSFLFFENNYCQLCLIYRLFRLVYSFLIMPRTKNDTNLKNLYF